MTNPFRDTAGVNAFDIPMTEGQREARPAQSGGQVQNALSYDPIGKTCSPNLNALLETLHSNRNSQLAKFVQTITISTAEELQVLREQIAQLQSALDVERDKVADAIRYAGAGFLGENDSGPVDTLGELNRRHAEHKKRMGR